MSLARIDGTVGQYPQYYGPPAPKPTFLESFASFIPGALGVYFQKRQQDKQDKFALKMAAINMPLQEAQLKWGAEVKKAMMIPIAVAVGVVGIGGVLWMMSRNKKKAE